MNYTLKHCWVLDDYTIMPDRRNGGSMMRLTFVNMATQVTADTYVCPANRNARNWTQLLNNLHQGHIVADLKLVTKRGKTVISADSTPDILWSGDAVELENKLKQLWSPKNNYGDLFE
jgi:hypothetical protein